jgi:DNA-binding CsgD family transcriptional regulator
MVTRTLSPVLIGRTAEFDELDEVLHSVRSTDEQSMTVLVTGDAGIGKSRLVEEFCSRIRADGILTATGACAPLDGGGPPYGPVIGILRDLADQLAPDIKELVLGPVIRGLGLQIPGAESEVAHRSRQRTDEDALDKTRLFAGILNGFAALADITPMALVFEDLHWADSASAELFDFLARNLRTSPILIIGTYRSEELGSLHPLRGPLTELRRHSRVTELRLQGLNAVDTSSLLTTILGYPPECDLALAVHARSEGNPFFVEELMAMQNGAGLSEDLRNVILLRVERLSPGARELLAAAAAAGPESAHCLLVAVAGIETATFDRALADLIAQQILVVQPDGKGYRFRHALLYEAVADSLLPAERVRLHGKIACVLTDPDIAGVGPSQSAAALAWHWWAAGEWSEALTACARGADAAEAVFAFGDAFEQWERVLACWDRVPDAASRLGCDRACVLERASDAAYLSGQERQCLELAQAAIAAIDPSDNPTRAAICLAKLGRNAWAIGNPRVSIDAFQQAETLLSSRHPSIEMARVLAEKTRVLMLMSLYSEAEEVCIRAITVARLVGARSEEGHALNSAGVIRAQCGHSDEGIAMVREALAIAEEIGNPDDLSRGYSNLSHLLCEAGRLEEAADVALGGMGMGEPFDDMRFNGAALNSADALFRLGRWEEAEELFARVVVVLGNCGMHRELFQAECAIRRGYLDDAARHLKMIDDRSAELDDLQFRGSFLILRAELAIEEGRPPEAWDDLERALNLAATTDDAVATPQICALGVRALVDDAELSRRRGMRPEMDLEKVRLTIAGLVVEATSSIERAVGVGGSGSPRATTFALLCQAEASRLESSDPEKWSETARCWTDLSERYLIAYARWREAEAVLNAGSDRGRATELLRQAWRIAEDLGAAPLRARIEQMGQRARIGMDPTKPEPTSESLTRDLGITAREAEVLGHLAQGRTDGQIAGELFISKKTASVHVSNIIRKLNVSNRVAAGELGRSMGLGESGATYQSAV